MPLVAASGGEEEVDERTRRARKIQPHLARGEPQRVMVVRNLAEGELIQGILLEEGIPSILRRTGGFDVPDMIAAGPRDVMVPASGVETARELLGVEADPVGSAEEEPLSRLAFRIAAVMLIVLLVVGLLTGTIFSLTR